MACQSTKRACGVLWVAFFVAALLFGAGCKRRSSEAVVSYFVAYALVDGSQGSSRVDMTADVSNPLDEPIREVKLEVRFVDGTTEVLDVGEVGPRNSGGQYRAFPVKGGVTETAFLGGAAETYTADGDLHFIFCGHVEKATLRFLYQKAPRELDVTPSLNALLPESFKETSAYIEKEQARRQQALKRFSSDATKKAK